MLDIESLCKVKTLLDVLMRNVSDRSGDFTCSRSREKVENVSDNTRPGQTFWIFNRLSKIQYSFRVPKGTFVVHFVIEHAIFLKKLKM